jgi:lipopolysaccharide/colanic/teichoic acid biosynthesis glycosyltransferase
MRSRTLPGAVPSSGGENLRHPLTWGVEILPMLERLASYLRTLFGSRKLSQGHGFLSVGDFARVLEIERHRADRSEAVFSLLVLTPRDARFRETDCACLATLLRRRLRITDQAGWLDGGRIGVLFPETPAVGAWTVADDVCLQFPQDVCPPACKVLTYPSAQVPPDDNGGDSDAQTGATEKPIEAMEPLFLVKTPLAKRAVDVVGSLVGLLLLSPLMLTVAAIVKWTSPGPIFYTQLRSGQGGKPFLIYKFRSMVVDADARKAELMALNEQDGPAFKLKNDPRVTRIGRFIRKTSIDELPQLWNVLRGEMSLVGPRAMYCPEVDNCSRWQRRRLDVRQGVTCIWQVRGRSSVSFDNWMRMDLEYIRERSLYRDVTLLAETVPAVLFRRGAC